MSRGPWGGKSKSPGGWGPAPRSRPKDEAPVPAHYQSPWVQLSLVQPHPLIWKRTIQRSSRDLRPGDLAWVYGPDEALVGQGLYAPRSQYALRMLEQAAPGLSPAPVNADWLKERALRALNFRREELKLDQQSNAWRVIHGEGDELPSLIIDRFSDVLSIEVFTEGWLGLLPPLVEALRASLSPTAIVVRADRRACEAEGFKHETQVIGQLPRKVTIEEHGLRYRVDPLGGHKTGFFCDQRDNRLRLRDFVAGRRVLDVCSYSGGFALNAARAGAREVTAVDLDRDALALLKTNAGLNDLNIRSVEADAFAYLRQMKNNGEKFGVVVLDPPKFIPDRASLEEGKRKYIDLNRVALDLLEPGGILLSCSCSGLISPVEFVELLQKAEHHPENHRRLRLFDLRGPGADHPVRLNCTESSYLKAAWIQVL